MGLHRKLGLASLVLAPLVLVHVDCDHDRAAERCRLHAWHPVVNNILFVQIRSIVLFPIFFIWALRTRRTDPQTHKRMMLLATLMLLDAAIARITWLPHNDFPKSYLAIHLYLLLLMVPALLYDLIRLRRIRRAWVWGLVLILPWVVATEFVWGSDWWRDFGPKLCRSELKRSHHTARSATQRRKLSHISVSRRSWRYLSTISSKAPNT